MFSLHSKLSENLVFFVLASFIFMGIFGMGIGMEITDGQMSSCPFMAGHTTMCRMNITEHIAQWREVSLGTPIRANLLALVMALFAVVIIIFVKQFSRTEELIEFAARLSAYYKAHFVKVFDPLLIAFSDGVLNPKIYEPARI